MKKIETEKSMADLHSRHRMWTREGIDKQV